MPTIYGDFYENGILQKHYKQNYYLIQLSKFGNFTVIKTNIIKVFTDYTKILDYINDCHL